MKFWHCECVCGISEKQFTDRYAAWCRKAGYYFRAEKAIDIYASACGHIGLFSKSDSTKTIITNAIHQLITLEESIRSFQVEMEKLSSLLPEYEVVRALYDVGPVFGAQLMAEIGNIDRFDSKKRSLDSPESMLLRISPAPSISAPKHLQTRFRQSAQDPFPYHASHTSKQSPQ